MCVCARVCVCVCEYDVTAASLQVCPWAEVTKPFQSKLFKSKADPLRYHHRQRCRSPSTCAELKKSVNLKEKTEKKKYIFMTTLKSLLEKNENKEVHLHCLNWGGIHFSSCSNLTLFRACTWLKWQACSFKCWWENKKIFTFKTYKMPQRTIYS